MKFEQNDCQGIIEDKAELLDQQRKVMGRHFNIALLSLIQMY
jgi:hypothetical protein